MKARDNEVLQEVRNLRQEIKHLRADLEAKFGVKFSSQLFTEDDTFPFVLAVVNAVCRFDRESKPKK